MPKMDPALWRDIMNYLRRKHTTLCRQWFEELEAVSLDSGVLQIHTSNVVQQNYLQKKCSAQFTEAAQQVTGALVAVRFVTGAVPASELVHMPSKQPVGAGAGYDSRTGGARTGNGYSSMTPPLRKTRAFNSPAAQGNVRGSSFDSNEIIISPDYNFDTFVTGPNNQLAYAASVAVANQPGKAYNPLFIHGGVGLGKTHLLQAICQQILTKDPSKKIIYLSCDAFMTQFLDCVQRGQMSAFRHRYRHADVLVIDDIHFLSDRERTQEEFFHTFNELYQQNRQIVLSSDSPPSEIPQLEDRLVSRFQWGLVAQVTKPSYETKVAILRSKSRLREIAVPDLVIEYIASRIDTNARELEGALTTIQGHAQLQNLPVTLELAKEALGETSNGKVGSAQMTLQQIIDAVTSYYNVKLSDLQSKRRHKSITGPRQVCMWLARKWTRFSLEEIGGYFGGRDHTTVMHSIRIIDQRMGLDPNYETEIRRIDESIVKID